MAESSSHTDDRSSRVEERGKCAVCSRSLGPTLSYHHTFCRKCLRWFIEHNCTLSISCHHTFCRECLLWFVENNCVKYRKCQVMDNLSADGLERLRHLLEVRHVRERISLAISERHYRTPPRVMVTPSRTDSNGDVVMVTPSMTEHVTCFVCSGRFLDPTLLSCQHTFCRACLHLSVINDRVTCPKCRTVHNLSADGLEGLPSSPVIIHLLKIINTQERVSLAIRQSHARDINLHFVTPDIAMVTPSMPGYAERRGKVFLTPAMLLGGKPVCIAVSPAADRLYVTVEDHQTVLIVDDRGKLMKTAYGPDVSPGVSARGGKLGFNHPQGIAVNKDGDVIVSDRDNHRVVVLSRDGDYIKFMFGTRGKKDGQFVCPCGVAVDDACSIYVCDCGNDRVQVFTRDGEYLRTFDKPDNVSGVFRPMYLSIARTTGRVYVTALWNHRVYVYTPLGRCITCFGTKGRGEGEMYGPWGICVDDDGRVIITDRSNPRVRVFNGAGTYHCTLGAAHDTPPLSQPHGLTIDQTGRVFVADWGNRHVLVF